MTPSVSSGSSVPFAGPAPGWGPSGCGPRGGAGRPPAVAGARGPWGGVAGRRRSKGTTCWAGEEVAGGGRGKKGAGGDRGKGPRGAGIRPTPRAGAAGGGGQAELTKSVGTSPV